jgi:hypothetical protein
MRDERFTFLCNRDERELLAELSSRLSRTQSDVVRLLIREAARDVNTPQRGLHQSTQAAGASHGRE